MTRLSKQPDLIVRRGGKSEQRRGAQAIQINLAVHMRKEIDDHARAHAFFVAEQENLLHFGQLAAVHGEDDLIDDVPPQQFRQVRESGYCW